jgi:flavin reductase (DIM6/NTAB) family NADH-FMN oxidoreductase RutF
MGVVIGTQLPARVVEYLRGHRVVYVATIDESGWPDAAPISWVTAIDPRTIRLAVDSGVETVANVAANGRVILSLLGGAMSVSIKGRGRIVKERMEAVAVPTSMIEVEVLEVKDDSFWGRPNDEGLVVPWSQRRQVASDIAILAELNAPS